MQLSNWIATSGILWVLAILISGFMMVNEQSLPSGNLS